MKRACPVCERPAVGALRLFSLGGHRRAICANCGARIGVSLPSSFVLLAIGTWLPIVGGFVGAVVAARISKDAWPIGGAMGALLTGAVFGLLYFRGARLVAN